MREPSKKRGAALLTPHASPCVPLKDVHRCTVTAPRSFGGDTDTELRSLRFFGSLSPVVWVSPAIIGFSLRNRSRKSASPQVRIVHEAAAAAAAGVGEDHVANAVLLKDAAGYLLCVIPGNSWVGFHGLQAELNREFELAPEAEVEKLFSDCDPGAIPCTGKAYGIETIVDEALASLAFVYFESGDHEHLVRVGGDDFHKLMSGLRHGHFSHEE